MGIPISTLKKITVAENMSGSKQDNIKDNVVRLRGLPFSATKADIERFFGEEYEIVKDGILLPLSADGRASGQAYVQFGNEDDATKAIEKKNKQIMGHRYIELYASSMEEAYRSSQKCRGENRSPKGVMNYNGMPNYNGKPITGLRYAYGRGYGPNGPPTKGQRDNSRYPTEYGQMNMFRGLNNLASAKKLGTILLENVNKQNFAVLMAKDLPITLAKNFLNSMFTVWAKKWKFAIKCSEENVRLKFARLERPVLKRLSNHQLWDA